MTVQRMAKLICTRIYETMCTYTMASRFGQRITCTKLTNHIDDGTNTYAC